MKKKAGEKVKTKINKNKNKKFCEKKRKIRREKKGKKRSFLYILYNLFFPRKNEMVTIINLNEDRAR